MTKLISYQGEPGAYSEMACQTAAPDHEPMGCATFEDAFAAVVNGKADLGMIPVENAIAGRVTDVHSLLPKSNLHIVGEHYQPIVHHLLALPGTKLEEITKAHAHIQSLMQCKEWLSSHNIQPVRHIDNGAAAAELRSLNDKTIAAIASQRAGQLYNLESLAVDIADRPHNTTRFLILSRQPSRPPAGSCPCVTTLLFRVRSVPAALYKTLGGFATNGINITKLESYLVDGNFQAAQFYVDVEGHPEETPMQHALDELKFFAEELRVLGTYPASPFRLKGMCEK